MAINAGQLVVLLSANDAQFRRGIRRANNETRKWANRLRSTRRTLARFTSTALRAVRVFGLWASSVAAVGAAYSSFRIIQRTTEWARELTDLSAKTQINVVQLQRYEAALAGTGLEMREFADILNTLAERLVEFGRGESTAIDFFSQLGVDIDIVTGRVQTQEEALISLGRRYQALSRFDPTLATASVSEGLGGGATLLLEPLLRRYDGNLQEAARRLDEETGGGLSAQQLQALDQIAENVRITIITIQRAASRVVARLAPILDEVSTGVRRGARELVNAFENSEVLNSLDAHLASIDEYARIAVVEVPRILAQEFGKVLQIFTATLQVTLAAIILSLGGQLITGFSAGSDLPGAQIIATFSVLFADQLSAFIRGTDSFFQIALQGITAGFDAIANTQNLGAQLAEAFEGIVPVVGGTQEATRGLENVADAADEARDALRSIRRRIVDQISDQIRNIFDRLQNRVDDLRVSNQLDAAGATSVERAQVQFIRDLVNDFDDPIAQLDLSIQSLESSIEAMDVRLQSLEDTIREFEFRFPNVTVTDLPEPIPPGETTLPEVNALEDIADEEQQTRSVIERIWRGIRELVGITEAQAQIGPVIDLTEPFPDPVPVPQPTPTPEDLLPTQDELNEVNQTIRDYAELINRLTAEESRLAESLNQRERIQGIIDVVTLLAPPSTEEEQRFLDEVISGLEELQIQFDREFEGIRIGLEFDGIQAQRNFNRTIADLADSIQQDTDRSLRNLFATGDQAFTNEVLDQFEDAFNNELLARQRAIADLQLQLDAAQAMVQAGVAGSADRVAELEQEISEATISLDVFNQSWEVGRQQMEEWARQEARLRRQVEQLVAIGQSVESAFTRAFENVIFEGGKLRDAFRALVQDILREIIRIAIIQPIVQQIGSFFSLGIGQATGVPGLATGGNYPGGLALVGERGPELIDFNRPGRVYSNAQLRTAFGGTGQGGDIYNHFQIASTDGPGVRQALSEAIPGIVAAAKGEVTRDLGNRNSALSGLVKNRAREA